MLYKMNGLHHIHDTRQADAALPFLLLSLRPNLLLDYRLFHQRQVYNANQELFQGQIGTLHLSIACHRQNPGAREIYYQEFLIWQFVSVDEYKTSGPPIWCTTPNHIQYPMRCECLQTLYRIE